MTRDHHRPATPGGEFFEELGGGEHADQAQALAERTATLLVRGARAAEDRELADRVVHLADNEGLETVAELWSHSSPDSLAGALWRLFVLRTWVHRSPALASREFDSGIAHADVAHVLAGVATPPGPDEVKAMIDDCLRGIADGDFADVLFRASAFARVVSAGRAVLAEAPAEEAARMLTLAEQLHRCGRAELAGRLA